MYMVVILHLLGQGGVLSHSVWMSGQYLTAWLLEIAAFCAVDCFGLISGYVGYTSKFRWSRLVSLWLQVVFFSVGISVVFAITVPGSVSVRALLQSFFPVTYASYWYITAYFGMFLLTPFLNIAIQNSEEKQVLFVSAVSTVAFLVIPTITKTDPYYFKGGYSTFWLCILYLAGGWIRKYKIDQKIKKSCALIVFAGSTVLAFLSKIVTELMNVRYSGSPTGGDWAVMYTSPFIVINGIVLLCLFAQTKCKTHLPNVVVSLLSPAALGVYLIHTHPLVWEYGIKEMTAFLADVNPVWLGLAVLGIGLAIYLGCSVIELLRLKAFALLCIPERVKLVDRKVDQIRIS